MLLLLLGSHEELLLLWVFLLGLVVLGLLVRVAVASATDGLATVALSSHHLELLGRNGALMLDRRLVAATYMVLVVVHLLLRLGTAGRH